MTMNKNTICLLSRMTSKRKEEGQEKILQIKRESIEKFLSLRNLVIPWLSNRSLNQREEVGQEESKNKLKVKVRFNINLWFSKLMNPLKSFRKNKTKGKKKRLKGIKKIRATMNQVMKRMKKSFLKFCNRILTSKKYPKKDRIRINL